MWTAVKAVCCFVRNGAENMSEQDANEAWRGQGETKFPLQVSERKRTVGFLKKMGRKPCTQALGDKPYMDVNMGRKYTVGDKPYG